jgi:hypothetical protein
VYDILVCAYFENKVSVEIYLKTSGRKIHLLCTGVADAARYSVLQERHR